MLPHTVAAFFKLIRSNMVKSLYERFISDYNEADMILIGIGSQLHGNVVKQDDRIRLLRYYLEKIEKKNYFIITTLTDDAFLESGYNRRRLVRPLLVQDVEDEEKQWELYNKWLSATLNKKLMIIELGEDFNHPNIFRWPFEKVVFVNQKSYMYRVHDVFYQLPENIGDRATSVEMNALTFLQELSVLLN